MSQLMPNNRIYCVYHLPCLLLCQVSSVMCDHVIVMTHDCDHVEIIWLLTALSVSMRSRWSPDWCFPGITLLIIYLYCLGYNALIHHTVELYLAWYLMTGPIPWSWCILAHMSMSSHVLWLDIWVKGLSFVSLCPCFISYVLWSVLSVCLSVLSGHTVVMSCLLSCGLDWCVFCPRSRV